MLAMGNAHRAKQNKTWAL